MGVRYALERTNRSTWSTPLAVMRTSTSVGPGRGVGSSPCSMSSVPPRARTNAARMVGGALVTDHPYPGPRPTTTPEHPEAGTAGTADTASTADTVDG